MYAERYQFKIENMIYDFTMIDKVRN